MRRIVAWALIFFAGSMFGAASVVAAYIFVHRDTMVYTTNEEISAEGIVIPPGTELIHHAEMSEGFDTLVLFLNVEPADESGKFTKRVDDRSFLVRPYWVGRQRAR